MALAPEKVAAIKATYPAAQHLVCGEDEVVVRPPDRQTWRRFKSELADEAKKPNAVENLLIGCTLLPDQAELAAMLDRKPALAELFGSKVVTLAVGEAEVTVKN